MASRRPKQLLWALLTLLASCAAQASFTEQLTLRPLPAIDQVLARFQFSVVEPDASSDDALFPNVLRHVLEKYDAESLHLTFSTGRYADWRYGSAQSSSTEALAHAPFGTRLQVSLRDDKRQNDVLERWRGLTSELGGIFSASLGQMDATVATELLPESSPRELGAFPGSQTSGSAPTRFVHGSLAREELCSENLTPWLKLLPCRAISGLGALIDPINVLSGEYLSLSLFASRSTSDGVWSLHQHLTTVQRPNKRNKMRRSLASLFLDTTKAAEELAACPLAAKSVIYTEDTGIAPVDLTKGAVSLSTPWFTDWEEVDLTRQTQEDVVSVHRFVTGHGQVHGGLAVQLRNAHPTCSLRVTYYDVIPWYLRLYFHTSRFTAMSSTSDAYDASLLLQTFDFVPAELRGHPNQLRLEAILPANTSLILSVDMEKAFLRLSEHPPDANRGFDVAPGVATFQTLQSGPDSLCDLGSTAQTFTTTLFTEPLLVPLPTPDFSMPYNVITMTSTVVAFFVGSMLNTLLRKAPRIKQMMAKSATKKDK